MGPTVTMLASFVIWFIVLTAITVEAAMIAGRYICYHGPEDAESWDPDDPFIMPLDK